MQKITVGGKDDKGKEQGAMKEDNRLRLGVEGQLGKASSLTMKKPTDDGT